MTKVPFDSMIRYERSGEFVRYTTKGMTNHEIREVMVGIWSRLDPEDRKEHIRELTSYQNDQDSWLSPIAVAIKRGLNDPAAIDLRALIARGEKVRP